MPPSTPEAPVPPVDPPPEAPEPPSTPPVAAQQPASREPAPAAGAVAVAAPVALELESLRQVWPAVLENVKAANGLCAAALAEAHPIAVEEGRVTIAFARDAVYSMRQADREEYRACVCDAIRAVTGGKAQVAYVLQEPPAAEEQPAAAPTDQEWVRRFVAEFDAEEIHPESEAS
jgi:hypothetical protein